MGHWCICAWAFAAAVQRDPVDYEGIILDCERTNKRLRSVYKMYIKAGEDLRSPSGAYYKAAAALEAVNKICGDEKVHGSSTHVPVENPIAGDGGEGTGIRGDPKPESDDGASSGGISTTTSVILGVVCSCIVFVSVKSFRRIKRASGEAAQHLKTSPVQNPARFTEDVSSGSAYVNSNSGIALA